MSVVRNIIMSLALVCLSVPGFAASGKLIVYTSQLEADAQQTVNAFKKVCPGIDVQWTRTGTSELMNKLRAEFTAGKPQPDVILIADMVTMEGLKREGRLMAYRTAPIKGYAKGLYDTDGYYFSTKIISTGIIYNDKAPFKPESIKDLIRPDAKGMVIMPSPLYSGAAAIHMHTLTQNPSLGWQIYEELAKNKAVNSKGNGGTFKAVASGEKLFGFCIDYLPIRNKLQGSPVTFIVPKEGASAVTEPVAILSTAQNPEAARKFVDFLLSREGQELASAQGFMPAMDGIEPPDGFPSSIQLMPMDAGKALEDDKADKKKFSEIFGG